MHKPLGHLRVMVCYCCLAAKLTLCGPMDCSSSGSSVHGILQVRILEWVAFRHHGIFSRKSLTHVSCTAGRFFTTEPVGKPDDLLACPNKDLLMRTKITVLITVANIYGILMMSWLSVNCTSEFFVTAIGDEHCDNSMDR